MKTSKPNATWTASRLHSLRLCVQKCPVATERQDLNRMESNGVITRIDQPMQSCAGKVAIPKNSTNLCISKKVKESDVKYTPSPKLMKR